MTIDWSDRVARDRLIECVGPDEYERLHAEQMARSTAATVRWPGVRIAPTTSTCTQSQIRSLNTSSNTRRTRTISLGRASMAHPFWQVGCESTVPCLSRSVYQMDKA